MANDKRTRQKLEAELAVLLRKGRLDRAALVLRSILEKAPDDDRLFVKLAEVCLKRGDEAGVRAAFRGAADAAERKGFYLRAMAALRQLARYLPPPERPWTELAELAFRLGLVADALGFLDEGTRAWEAAGDRAAVLRAAQRAHELAPDDAGRTLRLALALRGAERRTEAVGLISAEAARHRAAGRADAWLALAGEQASLVPTDRALACEVATAHLDRGEPRKALQRLQALLRERAQHVESLRLLVRTFGALELPGKRLAAVRELARALTTRRLEREARPLWRELVEADPGDAEARRALGLEPAPPLVRAEAAWPAARAAPVEAPAPPPLAPPGEPEEEIVDLAGAGVEVEDEPPAASPPIPAASALPPSAGAATPPPGSPLLAPVDITLLELDPEPPPEAAPAHADLEDELAHAGFLVAHRFADEARELLSALEASHPGHPGVAGLRARLEAGPELVHPHPAPPRERAPATGLEPSAAGIPSEGQPAGAPALEAGDVVDLVPAEVVLARFREQVALAVPADDAATRYDLAIAYREMGLLTEARAEFEVALGAATGPRAVDCLVGLALCEAAQGHAALAARTLKRALAHQALTPAAAAAVLYELGVVREQAGDARGAAWAFRAASRSQPRFRDAAARAERLLPGSGGTGDAGGPVDLLPSGA